jgi:hypothetical protein
MQDAPTATALFKGSLVPASMTIRRACGTVDRGEHSMATLTNEMAFSLQNLGACEYYRNSTEKTLW